MKIVGFLKEHSDDYEKLFNDHDFETYFIPTLSPVCFINVDTLKKVGTIQSYLLHNHFTHNSTAASSQLLRLSRRYHYKSKVY
jgi:hypothetical protein